MLEISRLFERGRVQLQFFYLNSLYSHRALLRLSTAIIHCLFDWLFSMTCSRMTHLTQPPFSVSYNEDDLFQRSMPLDSMTPAVIYQYHLHNQVRASFRFKQVR